MPKKIFIILLLLLTVLACDCDCYNQVECNNNLDNITLPPSEGEHWERLKIYRLAAWQDGFLIETHSVYQDWIYLCATIDEDSEDFEKVYGELLDIDNNSLKRFSMTPAEDIESGLFCREFYIDAENQYWSTDTRIFKVYLIDQNQNWNSAEMPFQILETKP